MKYKYKHKVWYNVWFEGCMVMVMSEFGNVAKSWWSKNRFPLKVSARKCSKTMKFFCEIIKEWEFWQFCELFDRTLDSTMALVKVQLLDCRGLMFNKGERGSRGVKIFRLHLGTFIGMVDGLVEQELHHSTKYWASFNEILWEEYSKIY